MAKGPFAAFLYIKIHTHMEPYNKGTQPTPTTENTDKPKGPGGRVWAGILVVIVGAALLARSFDIFLPHFLFTWPMLLIVIGLFIGVRHRFRNWGWLFPFGIGLVFLLDRELYFRFDVREFLWPTVIIIAGLYMIFRPRKGNSPDTNWTNFDFQKKAAERESGQISNEDYIDTVSVFGSTRKNILSKDFKGGEVVSFFGGTELNLHQADITGPIQLEVTQVFGGTKLIVPSNWRIQSELVSVFGGVDDKRMVQPNVDQTKVLVLRGTNVFGGLEIKSY